MDGGNTNNANPFFRSLNQSYGEPWQSSNGVNPLHLKDTPEYKDLVSYHNHDPHINFREREKSH